MIDHRRNKDMLGDQACGQYARCFVSCQSVLESLIVIADMLSVISNQVEICQVDLHDLCTRAT